MDRRHQRQFVEDRVHPGRAEGRRRLDESIAHDYSTSTFGVVPATERRPMWHFAGLWTTFVAGFSFMVVGFELHDGGHGLLATVELTLLGWAIYVAYALVGAFLGAESGQTLALLTRAVFGRAGSWLVSLFILVTPLGWVGFQAGVLAQLWHGFYGWGHLEAVTVALSAVMIFNNLFGFTGISTFARYIVTPVIIVWCGYLVVKVVAEHSSELGGTPHGHLPAWVAVAAVIGFAMWGNEPDIWRYGTPRFLWPLPTYLFAGLWFLLFSASGWMMAQLAGTRDRFDFTVHYSLFGAFWLAFVVATISQFAVNDANYYESINAGQNLLGDRRQWRRVHTCLAVAAGGAFAGWFVNYEIADGWFVVPILLAITVPCATTIIAVDRFVLPRWLGVARPAGRVPAWDETGAINLPAVVALLLAVGYGTVASAILPAHLGYSRARNWGPVPLECWVIAGGLYLGLVALIRKRAAVHTTLGFPRFKHEVDEHAREALVATAGA